MAKSHRDNHQARINRGPDAFQKKQKRRRVAKKRKQRADRSFHSLVMALYEKREADR